MFNNKTITIIVSLIIGAIFSVAVQYFVQINRLMLTDSEISSIVSSHNVGKQQSLKDIVTYFDTHEELKLGNLILIKKNTNQ